MTSTHEHEGHTSPEDSQSPDRAGVAAQAGGNVDKIRDILFGSQMRDYEARFARLEETLVKETVEIRETSRRRFEQLESYIKREFETVQARFKTLNVEYRHTTPEEFGSFVRVETEKWGKIVREAGIKLGG